MHTDNEKRGRNARTGKAEYTEQVLVLKYLYRGKHVFGESYESWMIPWMIQNPNMTIQMLKDYYGEYES